MNVSFCLIAIAGGILLFSSTGCSKRNDPQSLVAQVNAAFPAAVKLASGTDADASTSSTKQTDALVSQAVSAIQNNDYVDAVTLLRTVRKQPNLSAEQHMALQETIKTMYSELVNRGAHGDAKAKAALAELESKPS